VVTMAKKTGMGGDDRTWLGITGVGLRMSECSWSCRICTVLVDLVLVGDRRSRLTDDVGDRYSDISKKTNIGSELRMLTRSSFPT
jgi:hypothetical protein